MSGRARIFVLLPIEAERILLIFAAASACAVMYQLIYRDIPDHFVNRCTWSCAGFAFVYTLLKYVFRAFADERLSAVAVSMPAILSALLLRNSDIEGFSAGMMGLLVYLFWLFFNIRADSRYPQIMICIMADAVMTYKYFNSLSSDPYDFTGRMVYASLFILTAYHLRLLAGSKGMRKYPFVYFLVLLFFLMLFPARKEPIDWEPVLDAGRKAANKTKEMVWSVSYYIEDLFGTSYYTGYNSLAQNGDTVRSSDRTEIALATRDNTTFKYTDEQTGRMYKRRRTVYLRGGEIPGHDELLDTVFSMYAHGVDPATASLFARNAELNVTYEYLKTEDVIVPAGLLSLRDKNGSMIRENDGRRHKKGYSYHAAYMDLDFGSPYLEGIAADEARSLTKDEVSYKKLASYAYETFGIRLNEIVNEDEFSSWQEGNDLTEYTGTEGASDRMRDLARKITKDCLSDYEKCKAIEAYLRQYEYSTATGRSNEGDTGSAEGMSAVADDFLFETGRGYCVHYASAMVMLLRLNGIPARFMSGYRYVFPFEQQKVYEVKAASAHAWPEAYVKGFGWIGFEPTSGMSTAVDRTWHRKPAAVKAAYEAPLYSEKANVSVPVHVDAERDTDTGKEHPADIAGIVKMAAMIILSVVLMAVLLIFGTFLFKAVRYRMADPNHRLLSDVSDITVIIRSTVGQPFEDRGIMSDYDEYIPDKYRDEIKRAFDISNRIRFRCIRCIENAEKVTAEEEVFVRELRNKMINEYSFTFGLLFS